MSLFHQIERFGHESVTFFSDPASRLRMIVAVHNTVMGPALGGCRMWPYAGIDDALEDVLRLSRSMTYKATMAALPFGGGKAVVLGDPKREKDEALLFAISHAVNGLGGRYIVAEDVGMTEADMDVIGRTTQWVAGRTPPNGGSGDPSEATAVGVFEGMKSCLEQLGDEPTVRGRTVAIQGMGKVGYHLARMAAAEGAKLFISDIDSSRLERAVTELGAHSVMPAAILSVPCDIVAPCALGGVLNEKTIPSLNCRIVAGSANNQLATDVDGDALFSRGILYAPDYVINAGGLINLSFEQGAPGGYNRERAMVRVREIAATLTQLFQRSRAESAPPFRVADRMVEEQLAESGAKQIQTESG
ncbi:MAG TPA: Glu/Leu/Phe/Val dehydrogenase dimerization domain-containing protein [Nitrospiria bacterium]|nr:Glu/Leu/Phe/Val dehydrogenase dimerization domain-containing protein [Nitrospiria bacterium]